ncbi:MAG: sensor domain-containing diguanylate cyclase [Campylobacterota bacterium]|nr:sensor domain-containing diguanylate cyclase [Campylobacterota bacterium]
MFFDIFNKNKKTNTVELSNELYSKLNNCHSLKEVSTAAISFLSQKLEATVGVFYLVDNQNEQLNLSATSCISAKNIQHSIDLDDSLYDNSFTTKSIDSLEDKFSVFNSYGNYISVIPIVDEYKNIIAVSWLVFADYYDNNHELKTIINIIAEYIIKYQKDKENKNYFNLLDKYIITSSTNKDGDITFASEAFCKISGYSKFELLGNSHSILKHPDVDKSTYENLWKTIKQGRTWKGELPNLRKDGTTYWVKAKISPIFGFYGDIIGYTSIRQDITDKKLLETISITDALTNINNRRYFDEQFPIKIKLSKRIDKKLAFGMIDIDHFKQYNDTYGHQEGDIALKKVAQVLNNSLKREDDLVFRLGGEEFGLLYFVENENDALDIANKVRVSIENQKIIHKNNSASNYITVSMGLYIYDNDDQTNQEIYKKTDKLLYEAKQNGRNQVRTNINKEI